MWTSAPEGRPISTGRRQIGSGSVERLIKSPNPQYPSAFSHDGTRLVIREDAETRDLMVVAMDKEPRRVQPLVRPRSSKHPRSISPDGRLIAYASDESGQDEIYVRPFPDVNAGRWARIDRRRRQAPLGPERP